MKKKPEIDYVALLRHIRDTLEYRDKAELVAAFESKGEENEMLLNRYYATHLGIRNAIEVVEAVAGDVGIML